MSGRRNGSRRSIGEARRAKSRPKLEALEPRQLLTTYTVINTADSGIGSLRYAINLINTSTVTGANVINFNIATDGSIQTILPLSPLPTLTKTMTIDGSTELTPQGTPAVEIKGILAGAGANGLTLAATKAIVQFLDIDSFSGAGVYIQGSQDRVVKSFIGTDPTGTTAAANSTYGIAMPASASSAQITGNLISGNLLGGIDIAGGTNNQIYENKIGTDNSVANAVPNVGPGIIVTGGSRNVIGSGTENSSNVISGNSGDGVDIFNSSNNLIQSNYIGTDGDTTGTTNLGGANLALPNAGAGIAFSGSSNNQVGGTDVGDGNYISGNAAQGISIANGSIQESIQGNIIGAGTRNNNLGNGQAGIEIVYNGNGANGTTIGGAASVTGAGNTIAYNGVSGSGNNGFAGVDIESGNGIPILSNLIYSNTRLGIILDSSQPQPLQNTTGGGPANNYEPYPILTSVGTAAGETHVDGTFTGAPNSTYSLQFFSNPTNDPSQYGQGRTLLPFGISFTTDTNGQYLIDQTVSYPTSLGTFISATATDSNGNTSEFSGPNVSVTAAATADLAVSFTYPSGGATGTTLPYTITVTNNGPSTATNVIVTDSVTPTTAGPVPGSGGVLTGTTITWTASGTAALASIPVGGTVSVTFTDTPTVVGNYYNTAKVTSDEIDTKASNNQVTVQTQVSAPVDLALAYYNTVSGVIGSAFSLPGYVENNGPGVATSTTAYITIPLGVAFDSASVNQATYSYSPAASGSSIAGTVTLNFGTMNSSAIQAYQIVVTPSVTGSVYFPGYVQSAQVDTNPLNNSATGYALVQFSSDLSLNDSTPTGPVFLGNTLTYDYSVTNNGPNDDTDVTLTDTLPTGVELVSAPEGYSLNGNVLTIPIGSLAAGASTPIDITVAPTVSALITNSATISGANADLVSGNNSVVTNTQVSPADVGVSMTSSSSPGSIGQNLTYTITVSNAGPATANNVTVADTLPASLNASFVQAFGPNGQMLTPVNGVITDDLGTLAANQSEQFTVTVLPLNSSTITNTATIVHSDEYDPNTSNQTAQVTTSVSPADLSVGLLPSTMNALVNQPITYTAYIANSGPNVATNVNLSSVIPSGLSVLSVSSTQGTVYQGTSAIGVQLGNIPIGGSAVVTFVAQALTTGTIQNTVNITSDQVNPNGNNTASTAVSVTNAAGVVQFSNANYTAQENGGSVVLTVNRTQGTQGNLVLNYATADGSAVAGVNYTASSGQVIFQDGQTSANITIPIIDAGIINGNTAFSVSLSNPTAGSLGPIASATVTIVQTDFNTVGPSVTGLVATGLPKLVTGVTVSFSEALNPTTASNPANYTLLAPSGKKGNGPLAPVAIASVTYDASNNTVTITAASPLPLNRFYQVLINGSSATGVQDLDENLLQGGGNGVNGENFSATFARGTALKYVDANGNNVALQITKGGYLDLYRNVSGQGVTLTVTGANVGRSVLSGSVKRLGVSSTGTTSFTEIFAGPFGSVVSKLRTPPFYVSTQTATTAIVTASATPAVKIASIAPSTTTRTKLFGRLLRSRIRG